MKMKIVIAAAMLAAGLSVHAQTIIKFSHVVAADTPKGKASEFFAKKAAELTKGKVKVEVYANSALYKDKEEMEALQMGSVQMLAPSLAKFGPLGVKEFEAFDLPFIFDDRTELHKITQGPVGAALLTKLESRGIKGLAYWDNGFKSFSANSPLKTVADYKGKKYRIQSSKVLEEEIRAVGGIPQVIAFGETYQALQTGVVDGTENPPSNFYTQKMHEVQKHLSLTNHGYLGYAVIVNKKFWEALPADVRTPLMQAMNEATTYANQIAQEENDKALASVKASGKTTIYTPTAEERLALKKAMAPVHTKMADRVGKDTLQQIYQATGFDPSKL
ncbi:TRAP transporter substrate-binding protein [Rhodoferax sp. U2-2l]|uniref:TRAP transporter substrate-binding protein n=1 Tax=Rhodoferax sp. U2-2l TaxID=2884000 RepID=UPI001D09A32B|nr:TRAP transporter substrate-binding protein [Rhodoferax sp. U2-2l]MCB8747303.1 TRAP transporter substrate-binding protein [Rhodoferax sp. U2-2l]